MSLAIFDENFYLANNPDVKAAVDAGVLSSGKQHFEQSGLAEGRVNVSPFYNEKLYLEKYSDVADAIEAGGLKSGLQHYIQNGEAEGRSPGAFNEEYYKQINPDVAAAVEAGTFSSGLQHYIQAGQFEDNRLALFSGTDGNDEVTGFGKGSMITGVDPARVGAPTEESENSEAGEIDILTGGSESDLFVLGTTSSYLNIPQTFYDDNGDADYAVIKNFQPGSDTIQLGGYEPFFYSLQPENGDLKIFTRFDGDLIGVVEGVTSLSPISGVTSTGAFQIG